MDTKYKVLSVVGLVAVSAAFGRFTAPSKVVEKEHIVYQDRVVEKKTETSDTTTKKNVETIVTKKPDGTIVTETKDTSVVNKVTQDKTSKTDTASSETDKEKTTTYAKDSTIVALGAKVNFGNFTAGPSYGVVVDKRLIGPIWVGGSGYTDSTVGLHVGISF